MFTKWWNNHQNELPAWAEVCKFLLVQPFPAAAERVYMFSLLESSFSHKQNHHRKITYLFQLRYNNSKSLNSAVFTCVFFFLFNLRITGLLNGNNGLSFSKNNLSSPTTNPPPHLHLYWFPTTLPPLRNIVVPHLCHH